MDHWLKKIIIIIIINLEQCMRNAKRNTMENALPNSLKKNWSHIHCLQRVFASQVVRKLKEYLYDQSHHFFEFEYIQTSVFH